MDKITHINEVPSRPLPQRVLGRNMCVPYGKILRGMAVPNTVTKSLHTEKIFDHEIKRFTVEEYPDYSPLRNQIRTIKSFDRPVLLVDDLLHKGYRLRELDPLFKEVGLNVKKIIVGIMSGRGKDLMAHSASLGRERVFPAQSAAVVCGVQSLSIYRRRVGPAGGAARLRPPDLGQPRSCPIPPPPLSAGAATRPSTSCP